MKKAFITGITGQDGSYLAELLVGKGYEVHGLVRRTSSMVRERMDPIMEDPKMRAGIKLHYGDLGEGTNLVRLLLEIQPDEIYNLAAQSHVRVSFDEPEFTADVTGTGTQRLLEAIRITGLIGKARFYQASSSEMFGLVQAVPQIETTPFYPRSPYACAKLYSHWITINYRESYGLHGSSGILFNHESPRRGDLCDAENHAGGGADQTWAAETTGTGESGGEAGLGVCQGVCGNDVADAAAGDAG